MEEVAVARRRVGGAGDLEGRIDLAEIALQLQFFDRFIDGADGFPGPADRNAVLGDADTTGRGQVLELRREDRQIRLGVLLLFLDLQPVGEDELRAARAAIADGTGIEVEACNVIGPDEAVRFNPDHGDAGGAQVVLREEIVPTVAHARLQPDADLPAAGKLI